MSGKLQKVPFEEALDLTGFGKYNVLMGLVCGFMIVAMVFESLSVSYLVPASACELGTTTTHQGLMAAVPLVGIIATSHIWGYQADMRGRRKILRVSLVLGFLGGILSAFSPHWLVFCAFKLLSCSAVSGTFALSFTLLGETTPTHRRNVLILLTSSLYLLSTGLMAVTSIPILPLTFSFYIPYLSIYFNSWRLLTIVYSVPCALSAICIACVYESPKYILSTGREEEALTILKGIYAMNTGLDPEDFQRKKRLVPNYENRWRCHKLTDCMLILVLRDFILRFATPGAIKVKGVELDEGSTSSAYKSAWASVKSQTLPLVKPPLLKHTVLLSIMFALIYFCINPYIVWMPVIADGFMRSIERGETDLTICQMLRSTQDSQNQTAVLEEAQDCSLNHLAMLIVFINACVLSVCNIAVSGIINCIGRKKLLIAVQLITGVAGVCMNVSSYWVLSAIIFMCYIANCLNFGVLTTFSVNIFPTYLKAMAVCLTLMVGRASSIAGINILNQMLISNCEVSFYMSGGLTIFGGLLGFLLPDEDPKHKPDERKSPET